MKEFGSGENLLRPHRKSSVKMRSKDLLVKIRKWEYRFHNHKPYVMYRLECKQGERKWHVWKRFSEFTLFHQEATKISPNFTSKLPRKRFTVLRDIFDSVDKAYIDKRMMALDGYMQKVLFDTNITKSITFLKFVKPVKLLIDQVSRCSGTEITSQHRRNQSRRVTTSKKIHLLIVCSTLCLVETKKSRKLRQISMILI